MERLEALQRNGGDISNQRLAIILSNLYVELHGEIAEHKIKLDQLDKLVNSKLEMEGTAIRDVKIRLDCQSSLIKELKEQSMLLEGVALGVRPTIYLTCLT